MEIKRGDIYIVDFDPPKGAEWKAGSEILKHRPAVVVSRNGINKSRRTVLVVPLSSSPKAAPPIVVSVPSAATMQFKNSVAVCDQITAVDKGRRLKNRVGALSAADLRAVIDGVKQIID
jgi:mRNA interferase MazF